MFNKTSLSAHIQQYWSSMNYRHFYLLFLRNFLKNIFKRCRKHMENNDVSTITSTAVYILFLLIYGSF
jgi:hypothetical protein